MSVYNNLYLTILQVFVLQIIAHDLWFTMKTMKFIGNHGLCYVCLGFIVPLDNLSLIWRRLHFRWRVAYVDLCSALMAIELWGFFACNTYCGTASVYIRHLRGPITHTYCWTFSSERKPVFKTLVCRGWDSNNQPLLARSTVEPTASPPRFFFCYESTF